MIRSQVWQYVLMTAVLRQACEMSSTNASTAQQDFCLRTLKSVRVRSETSFPQSSLIQHSWHVCTILQIKRTNYTRKIKYLSKLTQGKEQNFPRNSTHSYTALPKNLSKQRPWLPVPSASQFLLSRLHLFSKNATLDLTDNARVYKWVL